MAFTYSFKFNPEDWLKDKENGMINESVKIGCVNTVKMFIRGIRCGKTYEMNRVMRSDTRKVLYVKDITRLCKVRVE